MIHQIETSVLAFFVGVILTYFSTRWSKIFKKIDALEFGVQAILRDRMLQMHKYYSIKKVPIPQREIDSFCSMYNAYKKLGANGYVDDIRHEIIDVMPHEPR